MRKNFSVPFVLRFLWSSKNFSNQILLETLLFLTKKKIKSLRHSIAAVIYLSDARITYKINKIKKNCRMKRWHSFCRFRLFLNSKVTEHNLKIILNCSRKFTAIYAFGASKPRIIGSFLHLKKKSTCYKSQMEVNRKVYPVINSSLFSFLSPLISSLSMISFARFFGSRSPFRSVTPAWSY